MVPAVELHTLRRVQPITTLTSFPSLSLFLSDSFGFYPEKTENCGRRKHTFVWGDVLSMMTLISLDTLILTDAFYRKIRPKIAIFTEVCNFDSKTSSLFSFRFLLW